MKLPSRFQIGDKVLVNFDFVQLENNSRTKASNAIVHGVSFTESKVFYDVELQTTEGEFITYLDDVDSYFMQDIVEVEAVNI